MKNNIDILFERLRIEYNVRDQLWIDVRKAVDEIGILLVNNVIRNWLRPTVAPAIEQLKDTPASIERTIVKLEKKSESIEKHKDKNNDISSLAKELWSKIIWTPNCVLSSFKLRRILVKNVQLGWWTGGCHPHVKCRSWVRRMCRILKSETCRNHVSTRAGC